MFVGSGVAYVFRTQIITFLKRPLHQQLYYTSPMGSFQFVMQVCLVVGVVLALPVLIYNILRFIEPVFSKGFSRKFVLLVLFSSLGLALAGLSFSYYLTLPMALKFFGSVGTGLRPLITANEYLSFMLGYLVTFAIVFQLPLLLLFINHITPFKPGGLTRWRKYVYIGAFAISLIMPSSPDPLSQVSLAIPIIALYELSVLIIWKVNHKRARKAAKSLSVTNILPDLVEDVENIFSEVKEQLSIAGEQAAMALKAGGLQPIPVTAGVIDAAETQPAPVFADPVSNIARDSSQQVAATSGAAATAAWKQQLKLNALDNNSSQNENATVHVRVVSDVLPMPPKAPVSRRDYQSQVINRRLGMSGLDVTGRRRIITDII
jgi:sec-independent protein translocase protein TatC